MSFKPQLHPDFAFKVHHIGGEGIPLLVIDNFLDQAEQLVDYCAGIGQLEKIDTYYPGIRMQAPELYVHALHYYLGKIFDAVFKLPLSQIQGSRALFSIVTTAPQMLEPKQRLPHIDSFETGDLACVHYLCGPEMGGTSMYRHRSTGYETVNANQIGHYNDALIAEGAAESAQLAYMNGPNEYFEQIASIDAAFNRIVVYPSNILHSGNIPAGCSLDADPRKGRLTLNTFVYRKRN